MMDERDDDSIVVPTPEELETGFSRKERGETGAIEVSKEKARRIPRLFGRLGLGVGQRRQEAQAPPDEEPISDATVKTPDPIVEGIGQGSIESPEEISSAKRLRKIRVPETNREVPTPRPRISVGASGVSARATLNGHQLGPFISSPGPNVSSYEESASCLKCGLRAVAQFEVPDDWTGTAGHWNFRGPALEKLCVDTR